MFTCPRLCIDGGREYIRVPLKGAPPVVIHSPVSVGVIAPHPFRKWASAIRLNNETIEIVVVPQTGRIHSLSAPSSQSVIWENDALGSHRDLPQRMQQAIDGIEFGVLQEEATLTNAWVQGQPRKSKAWINEDGSQACHLTRTLPPPPTILLKVCSSHWTRQLRKCWSCTTLHALGHHHCGYERSLRSMGCQNRRVFSQPSPRRRTWETQHTAQNTTVLSANLRHRLCTPRR